MKCDAAARPMTFERRLMGSTSAPYSHVVLFSMPSRQTHPPQSVSFCCSPGPSCSRASERGGRRGGSRRTVGDDKEVDSQHGKALANLVVGVLELALHDGRVDLDEHDARETGDDHPTRAVCVSHQMLLCAGMEREGEMARAEGEEQSTIRIGTGEQGRAAQGSQRLGRKKKRTFVDPIGR